MKATNYDRFLTLLHLAREKGITINIVPTEDGEYLTISKVHKNASTTWTVHKEDLLAALENALENAK